MLEMIFDRRMMFEWMRSRRRSRKRYRRRCSSGISWVPDTWNGSVSAAERTSIVSTSTSIVPLGNAGLTFSAVRATTLPTMEMTLSLRSPSAVEKAAEPGVTTHCVNP
jgi:hypothetical protein